MDLSQGTPMVAIPGPSILPDAVRAALGRAMPDIYGGGLVDLAFGLLDRLPDVARTSGRAFIVASNGHGAWQMAIANTIAPGESVLALESGRFAVFWGAAAELAGANVEILPGD
ncbi:MAG: alanine--glyoxylate aminotransferase family protein, partial [Acidimicrobiaceae bacterium]|nr:alanine--glyoxylate aminotransferase family protein [Acidimicrobiaceae bacterium]